MPKIIITPNEVQPAKHTNPTVTLWLELPEAFVDAKVRVFVYDKDRFENGPLGRLEAESSPKGDDPLWMFKQHALLADGENGMDARPSETNGLLFRMDIGLKRTKEERPRWSSGPPENVMENPAKDPQGRIVLRWLQDDLKLHDVGNIIFNQDVGPMDHTKFLLFRIALVSSASSLPGVFPNAIIVSNLRKDQNPAGRAVKVTNRAFESLHDEILNQLEQGIPDPQPPSAASRVVNPDLTGMYEAFRKPVSDRSDAEDPELKEEPVLQFQMNQAGHALVGWFNWPPAFALKARALAEVKPLQLNKAGCFIGYLDQHPFPIEWGQGDADGANKEDPVVPTYPMDLHGNLELLPTSPGGDAGPNAPPPPLELKLTLTTATNDSIELFLLRVRPIARLSRSAIDELMEVKLQELSAVNHIQPIPLIYWERLYAKCRPASLLGKKISEWDTATGSKRQLLRDEVSKIIEIEVTNAPERFRPLVSARFRHRLAEQEIVGQSGRKQSALDWMSEMVKEEITTLAADESNQGKTEEELHGMVGKGFFLLSVPPPGRFFYTFNFSFFGVTAKLIEKGGVFAFKATVTRTIGQERTPDEEFNELSSKHIFAGVFGEGGIGLSIGLTAEDGSNTPSTVEFASLYDLGLDDFDKALLFVEGASVGKGKLVVPEYTLAGACAVQIMVFPTSTHPLLFLSGEEVKTFDLDVEQKYSLHPLPKVGLEGAIAEISGGSGMMFLDKRPRPKKLQPKEDVREKFDGRLKRSVAIYFKQDLGTFEDNNRLNFEFRLAVERALLASNHLDEMIFKGKKSEGAFQVFGNASPEGTFAHNQNLSAARAAGVAQAIRDAFGKHFMYREIEVVGRGEDEALLFDHLDNPPDDRPMSQAEIAGFQSQMALWPKYRRVDVIVNRILLAEVTAEGK